MNYWKKIALIAMCTFLAWGISLTHAKKNFADEVFPWMKMHQLTKYWSFQEFRPLDSITRGEAAKFVTQYAWVVNLQKGGAECEFDDTKTYDETLRPFVKHACGYGLLKGSNKRFMPNNPITEAQSLAVVIRSVYGFQDETVTPWYKNYFVIAQEKGLLTNETLESVEKNAITREKLAIWLFAMTQLDQGDVQDDTQDDEDVKAYDGERDEDYDGNFEDGEWVIYETEVDSEEDCSEHEQYDAEAWVCYFECFSEEECNDILDQIDEEFAEWTEPLEDNDRFEDNGSWNESDDQDGEAMDEDSEYTPEQLRGEYTVSQWEKITLKQWTDSSERQKIWSEVAELSPNTLSDTFLESFIVYNNPNSDISASVNDDDGNWKWTMSVNLAIYNDVDIKEQKAIFIHELSHIITLNNKQVMPNTNNCKTYSTFEWCATPTSYLHNFVQKFWKNQTNPKYSENTFVTEYATTNQEEDIAESFAFFVLESNHNDASVRNQKVNFFNTYPELVNIRADMRAALAKYVLRAKK